MSDTTLDPFARFALAHLRQAETEERLIPRPPKKRVTLSVHPQGQPNVTVYYVPLPNGRVEVVRKEQRS